MSDVRVVLHLNYFGNDESDGFAKNLTQDSQEGLSI
jgi:hypothetical protein